ncbi:MAG: hypothetical protein H6627_04865 [Calditrichae bacterium]|nr:hypothetical protein [Calditrichota bacterium]MCB9057874.1 hypothetical protein [Calditrichia bacterium]
MRIFFLIFLVFFMACSEKKQQPPSLQEQDSISFNESNFIKPEKSPFFYKELLKIQQQIIHNPRERIYREAYIVNAYIDNNNALISLGSARTKDPESGTEINPVMAKRAALIDAKRWAVYGLLWLNNDFKPEFGKISEQYSGVFKELYSFNHNDSLTIAIATRVR